ncbi:DNRLRE domain-containing protein [Paenibacillus profundus]|uniref:DNRLRE domain-containing protein n=1 Tax=Paenibacillus profundus TaxID=1173085 RepID=A0ABS8YGG3_9BACL|nr:DNRLRE domain-containing protein [Paenibacillus profundus]MCE5169645.1 DNRLRE domain-containing protein [Paenibacillus profundus]
MNECNDISSPFYVKKAENKLNGKFFLYGSGSDDVKSTFVVATRVREDLDASLSVKVERAYDLSSRLEVMYRGNGDLPSSIQAIAAEYLPASLEVRPHNQMFGKFELLEAPRIETGFPSNEDATTRSRTDLQTINFGDTQQMMIGANNGEYFDSYVKFGRLKELMPDLHLLEKAKLKIYYTGSLPDGTNIELHQPHRFWEELGVTHANKPRSAELLSNEYTIDRQKRYIEFDVLDILKRWQAGSLVDYGFLIKSANDYPVYFYTRESSKQPLLEVKYISNLIYSVGRSATEATMFIYGVGNSERSASLTVHSDRGEDSKEATLYIHRPEVPVPIDKTGTIAVSRANMISSMTVGIRKENVLYGSISVPDYGVEDLDSIVQINTPEKHAVLTIDPNISLPSMMTVAKRERTSRPGHISVSVPHLHSRLEVSKYRRASNDLDASLTVQKEKSEDRNAFLTVNQPDLGGIFTVRAYKEDDVAGRIEIPHYDDKESFIHVSKPNLASSLDVKYGHSLNSTIYVKHHEYMESFIETKQISQIHATIDIRQVADAPAHLSISIPDLQAYLYPRVIDKDDLRAIARILKKNAADLHSRINVNGVAGAYYYIL